MNTRMNKVRRTRGVSFKKKAGLLHTAAFLYVGVSVPVVWHCAHQLWSCVFCQK